ncbi:MAG: methionine--tRNA ligase subunit beta, partial [Lentisphaerae bacterium]
LKAVDEAATLMEENLKAMRLNVGLEAVINAVRACNRYFEKTAPWQLAREGKQERLEQVLYYAANAMRVISGLLYPVMPRKMQQLRETLGLSRDRIVPDMKELRSHDGLPAGSRVGDVVALFPRIEVPKEVKEVDQEQQTASAAKAGKKAKKGGEAPKQDNVVDLIDIEDVTKLDLRTAKVLAAERIEGSKKLLKLQVSLGSEERQIVAGIAPWYEPEALVGKIIVVVANLKPARLMGVESQGMLLAAKTGKQLRVITTDAEDVKPGAKIS